MAKTTKQSTTPKASAKSKGASPEVIHSPEFIHGDEFHIPIYKLLQQDGTTYSGGTAPRRLSKEKALHIYQAMITTRILDERMLAAQRQGRLSFYMQCTGEEAAVIGSAAALDDDDMIMAQYREQGALAYRGFTIDEFMNQLFGNELDYGKGRQMPVHYGSKKAQLHDDLVAAGHPDPPGHRLCLWPEARRRRPLHHYLLRRRRRLRGGFSCGTEHGRRSSGAGHLPVPQQRLRHFHAMRPNSSLPMASRRGPMATRWMSSV